MTLNGMASFTEQGSGQTFGGQFTNFVITNDTTGGNDVITFAGSVNSACLGTQVTYSTPTALVFPLTMPCPTAGALLVTASGMTDRVTYTPAGGVLIDLGNNGGTPDQMFATCLDLDVCPMP
jgi:hypothetical protein